MTRKQAQKKLRSMMPDLRRYLFKETDRLAASGGIDLNRFDDDFIVPKILLTAALQNAAFQYGPYLDDHKKAVKNLSHF